MNVFSSKADMTPIGYSITSSARASRVGAANRRLHDFHPGGLGGKMNVFEKQRHERVAGIAEGGDLPHRRQHVAQHLNAFAVRFRRHHRHAGDVSAGPHQACDDPGFDGVGGHHDDGNVARRLLRRTRARRQEGDDHVDLGRYQLGRQDGKQLRPALRRPGIDEDIASLDIACFQQFFPEVVAEDIGFDVSEGQYPDAAHLCRLRARRDWPRRSQGTCLDDIASLHGIPRTWASALRQRNGAVNGWRVTD